METFLETERLVLRRFAPDDVDDLHALNSDPEVMRYLTGGIPVPRAVTEREILPRFLAYRERTDGYGFWAVIERASGAFLGWFHLRPPKGAAPDEPELGYRLHRAAWGKGYGTEGARALIERAFTELGARRVVASTYEENIGSRRVMEKAGMRLVRTFRPTPEQLAAHGTTQDLWPGEDVEYAIERADWERQRATTPPPSAP
jgi:RimJ/RimL family protein N-acetyltransferase